MGCDYYNDTDEDGSVTLSMRVRNEDGELVGFESVSARIPAGGEIYVDRKHSEEVTER